MSSAAAPLLAVEGVSVRFGGVVAVDGVSLDVAGGTTVGLVGPNGSGKSTFLNALTGVVPATGRATLAGAPLPLGRPRRTRRCGCDYRCRYSRHKRCRLNRPA